jgi:hypothetical protein
MRLSAYACTWHAACHLYSEPLTDPLGEPAMKFETLMLHGLFASCLMLCVGTLAAMLV